MANGTLTNHEGNITFNNNQKNTITLSTENTFVDGDIILNTLVTKAVLNTITTDTDHKTFDIEVPNGDSTITFNFTVDSSGNVLVT